MTGCMNHADAAPGISSVAYSARWTTLPLVLGRGRCLVKPPSFTGPVTAGKWRPMLVAFGDFGSTGRYVTGRRAVGGRIRHLKTPKDTLGRRSLVPPRKNPAHLPSSQTTIANGPRERNAARFPFSAVCRLAPEMRIFSRGPVGTSRQRHARRSTAPSLLHTATATG